MLWGVPGRILDIGLFRAAADGGKRAAHAAVRAAAQLARVHRLRGARAYFRTACAHGGTYLLDGRQYRHCKQ